MEMDRAKQKVPSSSVRNKTRMAAVRYLLRYLLLYALQQVAVSHDHPAPRASVPLAASCTRHCLRPNAPGPRRLAPAPAAAPWPPPSPSSHARFVRAGPEHARAPTLTPPTAPACLPHLRPHRACSRPPPTPLSALASPPATGRLNDLYRYSAADNAWTALSLSGSRPSPRSDMGFAATPDGMLYVFGGWSGGPDGNEGKWGGAGISAVGMGPVAWNTVTLRARAAPLHNLAIKVQLSKSCMHSYLNLHLHACTHANFHDTLNLLKGAGPYLALAAGTGTGLYP
jgi:hypothetical protein